MDKSDRINKRLNLVWEIEVHDRNSTALIGHLQDISMTGAQLRVSREYQRNDPLAMHIGFEHDGKPLQLDIDGECRWCLEDKTLGTCIGVEFTSVLSQEANLALGYLVYRKTA